MIAATQTRRPLIVDWDCLDALRQIGEAIAEATPGMLPHEARQAARVLWARGYRADERGHVVLPK